MNLTSKTILSREAAKFVVLYVAAGLFSLLAHWVGSLLEPLWDILEAYSSGRLLIPIIVLGGLPGFLTIVLSTLIRFHECPPLGKALGVVVVGSFLSMTLYFGFYIAFSPYIDEMFYIPDPFVGAWSATLAALFAASRSYIPGRELNGHA